MTNPRPEFYFSRLTEIMIEQGKELAKIPAPALFGADGKEIVGPQA